MAEDDTSFMMRCLLLGAIWLMAGGPHPATVVVLAMDATAWFIDDTFRAVTVPCVETAAAATWLEVVAAAITACLLMYCLVHACGGGGGALARHRR